MKSELGQKAVMCVRNQFILNEQGLHSMITSIIITVGSDVPIFLPTHFVRLLKEPMSFFHLQVYYNGSFFVCQFHVKGIASSMTL